MLTILFDILTRFVYCLGIRHHFGNHVRKECLICSQTITCWLICSPMMGQKKRINLLGIPSSRISLPCKRFWFIMGMIYNPSMLNQNMLSNSKNLQKFSDSRTIDDGEKAIDFTAPSNLFDSNSGWSIAHNNNLH